jgi:DNA topoisomerase VI subunit B
LEIPWLVEPVCQSEKSGEINTLPTVFNIMKNEPIIVVSKNAKRKQEWKGHKHLSAIVQ